MKIGIDLDEVLVGFLPALIKYHNATYQTSFKPEDFLSYQFWETWGGNKEEATQKVFDFHQTAYFKDLKPIDGTQKAINLLKQGNDLFIITSRQEEIFEITKKWINQYFPNCFSDILLTNNYSRAGIQKTKKHFCDLLEIETLIDDSLEYAVECLDPKRKILLMDCPWNKSNTLPQGIHRVYSWEEIINSI